MSTLNEVVVAFYDSLGKSSISEKYVSDLQCFIATIIYIFNPSLSETEYIKYKCYFDNYHSSKLTQQSTNYIKIFKTIISNHSINYSDITDQSFNLLKIDPNLFEQVKRQQLMKPMKKLLIDMLNIYKRVSF
jgi:hypothetical protein